MNKCVFLDRDGVLNEDCPDYVYQIERCIIPAGVAEALRQLKESGFLLIVITNQAGIARGLYSAREVEAIYAYIQQSTGVTLDGLYFCPHHPKYDTESLRRKPDSLMIEKAMAKYNIDPAQSWMIGDAERDILAGKKAGLRTIQITEQPGSLADFQAASLKEAVPYILA